MAESAEQWVIREKTCWGFRRILLPRSVNGRLVTHPKPAP